MRLSHWVNTVVCDKGFREEGILAEMKGKKKKKKDHVYLCTQLQPVGI